MKDYTKAEKKQIIKDFASHVSSGKAKTFKDYGMEFIIGKREGPYIWDITGKKKLINCHSNGGVFNLGHRNPEIVKTMHNALDELDIGNHHFISKQRADLGKKLAELMPGDLDYTVFGSGGGEAIDLALKLARAFTGKNDIISAIGGYHGHTGLAMATGDPEYKKPFGELAPGFIQIPFGDLESLKTKMQANTAAVILETIPATLGIVIPEKEYLQAVRKICDENGSLLILDEVQSGLGRTGKLWAFEHYDIIPDIVVIGKGLSGGIYPISATIFRKPYEAFFKKNPFIHISTFGGAEVGAAVALKVLEISSDPDFLSHVTQMAEYMKKGISALVSKHPKYLESFNQLGLMIGLRFTKEKYSLLFTKAAYESGMWALYANNDKNMVQILPPLIIDENHVEEIIDKIDKAVSKLKYYKIAFNIKEILNKLPW
ncbi:MAG: aspartate aminotransferase family protein [Bacteroidetes bacterium 4572_117]|nr:MAG: aspartate aminotransferase family protein [Bacteroidetes bacterium 4572_117]